jgi:hypothetical protein
VISLAHDGEVPAPLPVLQVPCENACGAREFWLVWAGRYRRRVSTLNQAFYSPRCTHASMPTTRSRPSSEPNDRHDRELKRTRAALQDDSIDSLTLRATCHLPPYSYFTEAVAPNPSIAESLSDSHPLTPRPLVGHSPGTPQLQAASRTSAPSLG